jgi:Raf kinase inhibitor-like YbhB/YbcL family protein
MWRCFWSIAVALAILAVSCGDDDDSSGTAPTDAWLTATPAAGVTFELRSPAFDDGDLIPAKYSCDEDEAPIPLSWSGVPEGIQSLALIFDDPDAPRDEPFVHWLMYNIPANTSGFDSVSRARELSNGALQGMNSRDRIGYAGPCPPEDQTHTYVMTLYALDTVLDLESGASRSDLEAAMEGHVVATAQLTGEFGR